MINLFVNFAVLRRDQLSIRINLTACFICSPSYECLLTLSNIGVFPFGFIPKFQILRSY